MNFDSGKFKCPHCNYTKIYGNRSLYQNWINRKVFINNKLQTEWIFYNGNNRECNKWECCKGCRGENAFFCNIIRYTLTCCCDKTIRCEEYCNIFLLCFPCNAIFYFLFCFWYDLFSLISCSGKTYYGISGKRNNDSIITNDINDFWDEIGGLTTKEMNHKVNYNWQCSNCLFCNKSFIDFIPKKKYKEESSIDDENTNLNKNTNKNINTNGYTNINTNTNNYILHLVNKSDRKLNDEIMAIHFTSSDQLINYSIPCKKSDIFNTVEKKLYKEYPDYSKKNCYFIANGSLIDKKKSMEKNNLKSGDNVLVNIE